MKLHLDSGDAGYLVTHYGPGRIVVDQEHLTRACVVAPRQVLRDWGPADFAQLSQRHIHAVVALEPELVVLGTGARQRFPSAELLRPLLEAGIGVEVMDTGAACRTYNILVGEGRRVAAALLIIEED